MELIAAVDRDWAIGRESKLLFSIPEDLAHFKTLTLGKAIVYGCKTLSTFPGGKPLAGRKNYVLTHRPDALPPGCVGVTSVSALLEEARGEARLFVAGGASVYRALLPYCTSACVTKVDAYAGGDCFCPNLDRSDDWALRFASGFHIWNGLRFQFCEYVRR